jgi:hypothetical protein
MVNALTKQKRPHKLLKSDFGIIQFGFHLFGFFDFSGGFCEVFFSDILSSLTNGEHP